MRRHLRTFLAGGTLAVALMGTLLSGQQAPGTVPVADEFARLHFRSIGPANMSGRISDLAVYEKNPAIYYVGSAHGTATLPVVVDARVARGSAWIESGYGATAPLGAGRVTVVSA